MRPLPFPIAASLCALALGRAHAEPMTDPMVYRCASHGRVTYQDAPCAAKAGAVFVNFPGDRPAAAAASGPSAPTPPEARTTGSAHALSDAVARIRIGMSVRDFEALDRRIRTSRSRSVDANGHKHEWRYVSADCVVHLADDVVVAIYR
jgi:hypothetical protein